jgi:hypothetical protein
MNKDLLVLVADKDMQLTVQALLQRSLAMNIRPIVFDLHAHPQHDAGVYSNCDSFLRAFHKTHQHALVLFDRHGSGTESLSSEEIEALAEKRISRSGWENRCRVVVIDPELEAWVWSSSRKIDEILGWSNRIPDLRTWLIDQGHCPEPNSKPFNPKQSMEAAMLISGIRWSSSVFKSLAEQVSFSNCSDRSFQRFCGTLRTWFPPEESHAT